MAERKNDISLAPSDLKRLSRNIEKTFRQHIFTSQKFTTSRTLRIYDLLQEDIEHFGGLKIGKTTLIETMTLKRTIPYRSDIFGAFKKYINAFKISIKSPSAIGGQKIYWAVNQGFDPGVFVDNIKGEFISWEILKSELENRVITQCPRIIPPGSSVECRHFYGRENWVIHILDKEAKQIGSVWIGGNPTKNWEQDGYVRIGKTISDTEWVVYQTLARFPDSSYRLVKSFV